MQAPAEELVCCHSAVPATLMDELQSLGCLVAMVGWGLTAPGGCCGMWSNPVLVVPGFLCGSLR